MTIFCIWIFFAEDVYWEISQTIKTTSADLISNTGGVLGLFLELSFTSSYRFINFLFDIRMFTDVSIDDAVFSYNFYLYYKKVFTWFW